MLRTALSDLTSARGGSLARGIGTSVVLKIISSLLTLLVSVLLARMLEPDGYGVYSFALSVTGILGVPVVLGFPTLVLREISWSQVSGQWSRAKGLLTRSAQFTVGASLLLIPVTYGVLTGWGAVVGDSQAQTLIWALVLLPLTGLSRIRESLLLGLGQVWQARLPDQVILPGLFIVMLGLNWFVGDNTPALAMVLYCGASLLSFCIGVVLLTKAVPGSLRASRASYDHWRWMRSLIPFSLLAGLNILMSQTDVVMLGVLSTKGEVGLYRVAYSGAATVLFFYSAAASVLMPRVAALYHSDDHERLQRLLTVAARFSSIVALPLALILILMGGSVLELVYGAAYQPAYSSLAVMAGAQFFSVAMGDVHGTLNMTGHESSTLRAVVVAAATNVILNFIFIPPLGSFGASISTTIATVLGNAVLVWLLWEKTGLWSPAVCLPWFRRKRSGAA